MIKVKYYVTNNHVKMKEISAQFIDVIIFKGFLKKAIWIAQIKCR